jgi:hypothetical protein
MGSLMEPRDRGRNGRTKTSCRSELLLHRPAPTHPLGGSP